MDCMRTSYNAGYKWKVVSDTEKRYRYVAAEQHFRALPSETIIQTCWTHKDVSKLLSINDWAWCGEIYEKGRIKSDVAKWLSVLD